MTIQVQAPDGSIAEFPNGTPDDVIERVMGEEYGAPPSTATDMLKAAGSGAIRGVAAIPGLPEDVGYGMRWLAEQTGRLWGSPVDQDYVEGKDFFRGPTSGELVQTAREYVPGADYDPKTTAGKYARTVGEFAPTAVAGPGRLVGNLAKWAVGSGVASEAAGQATEGSKVEPYARIVGAMLGGGVPAVAQAMLPGSRTAERALQQAMQGLTPQQVDDAQRLMTQAEQMGVRLTWPEALQQVTEGAAPAMTTLQRVAESDLRGRSLVGAMMGGRPQAVETAVRNVLDQVAPQSQAPTSIGPRLAALAEREIDTVRQGINTATEPQYLAAGADHLTAGSMQNVQNLPGFAEALAAVRGDPFLNARIRNLPDDNVLVLDAVKKYLTERAQNLRAPTNPDRSMDRSSAMFATASQIADEATNASPNLARALRDQMDMRQAELLPLQQGQMGRIADASDTPTVLESLLPTNPMPRQSIETADTTGRLALRDQQLTAQAVRARLEDQFQKKAKDLQGGPNQYGGASFRNAVYGSDALRENLRAALGELPNGPDLVQGLEELMEVLQATGRRERPGSMTAFNKALQDELKGGSPIGEMLTDTARLRPLGFLRDRYESWTLGRNMEDLARIISDPASRDLLLELARTPRNAPTRPQLLAVLSSQILSRSGDQDKDQSDGK
jgi:hypothetical protein